MSSVQRSLSLSSPPIQVLIERKYPPDSWNSRKKGGQSNLPGVAKMLITVEHDDENREFLEALINS